ncbi:MAG: indole-3-glycerol phosphate synthase TrpC, partial [Chloroflexota bacterium]
RPVHLARTYAANGAAMLSVLTDEQFFKGHLDYLREIRAAVKIPLLRKEFVVDTYQVYEARAAGADAVLLIVAALDDAQLADLHALIIQLGMTPLVEVHNEAELERALKLNPMLIGVNNRDLKTFDVDLETTGRLAQLVPDNVTLVAESGMKSTVDVHHMGTLGAHAVLIGEGLVTAPDIGAAVRSFSSQERAV